MNNQKDGQRIEFSRNMIRFETRENGAVPFWFWNGDQREDEITRQLEQAAEGGLKGMAIHARRGNRTAYMSDRWIELVRHSCEEALRLGLDIWLYDEEGFPSGTVGHRMQKDDPAFQQKVLKYDYVQQDHIGEIKNMVAAYDAETLERVSCEGRGADERLVFWMDTYARYVDTLKRATAERFMDMTHRRYFAALKAYFGKPITHIYTDDLNSYLDNGPSLPYTERLPDVFKERLGYDLLDHLPKLVENVPGCEKVRLGYRKIVLDLFLNEFVDPLYRWCGEHGVMLTGHLSGDEGEIDKSARRFGSAMAFYEYEHIPGIDDFLCSVPDGRYVDQIRNPQNHCPVILVKQASSVANQLKSGACGSEVLTFLGWGASVSGQSAFLNYQLALGVNLMTHHDFSYATGGVAKRDCPPSYFFQQPYWVHYGQFHDAIARSTQLLKRGRYDASVAVIHPMTSCWAALDGKGIGSGEAFKIRNDAILPEPRDLEDAFAAISHELLKMRVGFEFADEGLLAKHGGVVGGQLRMGEMIYATVIIPEVSNLLGSTVELLKRFKAEGGHLIALKPVSDCLVDGEVPDRPVFDALSPVIIKTPEDLRHQGLEPTVEISGFEPGTPVISHTRVVDGGKENFVCNMSGDPQSVEWKGDLIAYDSVANMCIRESSLVIPPRHAIHLLPYAPEGVETKAVAHTIFSRKLKAGDELPPEIWTLSREQPNLLLIDWCQLPAGPQRYHHDTEIPDDIVTLKVTINIPDPGTIEAIIGETVTLDGIRVNGRPLPPERNRQHPSSQDLFAVDATGLFARGDNEIEFPRSPGDVLFEPFYLMGDFAVDLIETSTGTRPVISGAAPAFGDLVASGLPFYWGNLGYQCVIDGAAKWIDCGEVDGVVTLLVNRKTVGCRYTAPYRFRIEEYLEPGANRIELILTNTAQNLYGPHRRPGRDALAAVARHGDYYLARFGIQGPVTLLTDA